MQDTCGDGLRAHEACLYALLISTSVASESRVKMKVSLASLAIGILALSLNAHADFSAVSSPAFGAGALTFDSSQNLYWLTPKATIGQSYVQVEALLATDPKFAQFRFGSIAELDSLFAGFGIPDANDYGVGINGTTANVPGATALQTYLGVTYSVLAGGVSLVETAGYLGSPFISPINGLPSVRLGDVTIRHNVATNAGPLSFAFAASALSSAVVGSQSDGVGSWLVSSVPEPPAWAMWISGLLLWLRRFWSGRPALVTGSSPGRGAKICC